MAMRAKLDIAVEVDALSDLSRDELIERWRRIYNVSPPKGVRQDLLVRGVAWHHQAKRLGGLSAETRRLLRSAISKIECEMLARDRRAVLDLDRQCKTGIDDKGPTDPSRSIGVAQPPRRRRQLTPGARLMREWNGKTHVVDVIEGGYVFEAKVYPSLTAIAGRITGAHWSGPRFFGL